MQSKILKKIILSVLKNLKGQDIVCFDMLGKSDITDFMIICTGMSNIHVISISKDIIYKSRSIGIMPYGIEGMRIGEWVLIDLGDVVTHIMKKKIRELYELEKLWS